jgi:hypothetical protein
MARRFCNKRSARHGPTADGVIHVPLLAGVIDIGRCARYAIPVLVRCAVCRKRVRVRVVFVLSCCISDIRFSDWILFIIYIYFTTIYFLRGGAALGLRLIFKKIKTKARMKGKAVYINTTTQQNIYEHHHAQRTGHSTLARTRGVGVDKRGSSPWI